MIDGKGIRGWKESNRGESRYVNKCNEWKEKKKEKGLDIGLSKKEMRKTKRVLERE